MPRTGKVMSLEERVYDLDVRNEALRNDLEECTKEAVENHEKIVKLGEKIDWLESVAVVHKNTIEKQHKEIET